MTEIRIEELSDVKKRLTFEVPTERVQEILDAEYRDLKKSAQIKGFRKGKAPLEMLRAYFKTQVEADAKKRIIEETFQPGLDEKKIRLVSVLSLDPEDLLAGQPFRYTAEIEVPPAIEVKGYNGLKLKKFRRELDEKQVDERLEKLRERNASLSPIPDSRAVQTGDFLVANIGAECEGAPIQPLTVTDYHLELGRNFYLPGFDVHIEGMKQSETRSFDFQIPEDFARKEWAGKQASFQVTVTEAKERVLPELDDDFAKDLGEDFQTLEELKEEVRQNLRENMERLAESEMGSQIVEALLEQNSFEVPTGMIENQVDEFLDQSVRNLAARGIDPKRVPMPGSAERERVRPYAERSVRVSLMLQGISEQEKIEVSDEELAAGIEERAKKMGVTVDHLKDHLEESNMLEDLRNEFLERKVYRFIEEQGEVTEEDLPEAEEPEVKTTEKE